MFAQSGHNQTKNSDFLKTFGNTTTTSRTIEPQQTERNTPRSTNLGTLNTDASSFFDFEPSESPYQNQFSTPEASGMSDWNNELNFHPLSPPNSASFSPKAWQYGLQHQNTSNVLTNTNPANTRAHYGQVTPPDDEEDNNSLLDCQLREQWRSQKVQPEDTSPAKKRKRNVSNANDMNAQPTKRTRKFASRGGNNVDDSKNKPEDVKRSKFLERNRVAASKCRQKKKEWTQNLETRARELQKNNNSLRMMIESCRQEVLFLKGELLKHGNCDCTNIQDFLKNGGDSLADPKHDAMFKRELSPFESMPASRVGSVDSGSGRGLHDFESTSPAADPSDSTFANDENALEALLTNSINHDTSDEGIASQVKR